MLGDILHGNMDSIQDLHHFYRPIRMTIIDAFEISASSYRHLPTVDKGIREENLHALVRRWKLAQQDVMDDAKLMQRWFPAQRELFHILSVLPLEKVRELADCGTPLFNLRLPMGLNDAMLKQAEPSNKFEAEAHEEAFMSLVARLDGLRTSPNSFSTLYDMSPPQANYIGRHSARELHCIAGDSAVTLIPAVADEYFQIAGTSEMTARERTVLSCTTRRHRTLA